MILALLCLLSLPARGAPLRASQSVGVYRAGSGSVAGRTTIGSTSLGATGARWRWRGSLGWWRWRPEAADGPAADEGLGALNLTLGRELWSSYRTDAATRGWAQVKGAVPLDDEPTPLGSGRVDWGLGLLATNRIGDFLVFAELDYLIPGDPAGVDYENRLTGAVSASWHRRGLPLYPVASFVSSSPLLDGYPRYGEWSAGLGAPLGRRAGLLALYSHGTTAGSPGRGLTAVLTLGL